MNLADPGNNVELALFHVRNLRQMRSAGPKFNIDAALQPLLRDGFNSTYYPATDLLPAWYWGGNNVRQIVYFDGVTTARHSAGLIAGYSAGPDPVTPVQRNTWLNAWADYVLLLRSQGHAQDSEYLDLVGYSAGGAVAVFLADMFVRRRSLVRRKVITFGAPRSGTPLMRERLSRSSVTRWMNDADPIPLIPPRLTDCPALIAVQSPLTAVRWGNYVHQAGGIELDSVGTMTPATLPSLASMDVIGSLASWYFQEVEDPTNPHALNTYEQRLQLALGTFAVPRLAEGGIGGGEDADENDRRDITRDQARTRAAIQDAGHAQNAVPIVVPELQLFQAVRLNRIWCVYFGDTLVIQAPREDRARHIARAGNDFLRSLPKQALVDPIALVTQMEQFLLFASTPGSGFTPTLRTNLDLS